MPSEPEDRTARRPRRTQGSPRREQIAVGRASLGERRLRRRFYGIVAALVAVTVVAAAVWIVHKSSATPASDSLSAHVPDGVPEDQAYLSLGADEASGKPIVDVYLDFMCPFCQWFPEVNNNDVIRLVEHRDITLRLHMTTMLDGVSTSGDYSTRAANAAACVYAEDPQSLLDFEARLFAEQPEEGTWGLTDDQLQEIAATSGSSGAVDECISEVRYEQWLHGTVEPEALGRITGTPTIFINGEQWDEAAKLWTKPGEFRKAVLEADR